MTITRHMSIPDLAQHMGTDATDAQASEMRDLLVARFDGLDTADVDDADWTSMLDDAVSAAMQTPAGVLEAAVDATLATV